MTNPSPYTRDFGFADEQATNPVAKTPGIQLDAEFDDVASATAALVAAIGDIRRADGRLRNGIVTSDSFSAGLAAAFGTLSDAEVDAAIASAVASGVTGQITAANIPGAIAAAITAYGVPGLVSAGVAAVQTQLSALLARRETDIDAAGLSNVAKRMAAGLAVSVAWYGTSITYGQQDPTGPRAAINGASQKRSAISPPEALFNALPLVCPGASFSVLNLGYPGDTSAQYMTRWGTGLVPGSSANVSIFEYGINDANGYGGLPLVPVAAYRANMRAMIQQRAADGSACIVLSPTRVTDPPSDAKLIPYRAAAREVAEQTGALYVDASEQLGWRTGNPTTDGVHLDAAAYNELGWHLAAALMRGGNWRAPLRGNVPFYLGDNVFTTNGSVYGNGSMASGQGIVLAPGQVASISGFVEDALVPALGLFNPTGADASPQTQTLNAYYGGTASGVAITPAGGTALHSITVLPTLHRGWRTLHLRNDDATRPVVIEAIVFRRLSLP